MSWMEDERWMEDGGWRMKDGGIIAVVTADGCRVGCLRRFQSSTFYA